jgi:DNA invertase Pin-like site-specific DNA recombinase
MTARKPTTTAPARQPVAHSYLRFSTPRQEWGDSTRRQVANTEAWSAKSGIPLSDLALADKGRSAFKGAHRDEKAALGRFLELAKKGDGPVRRGDYLVIENLDRLSREEERTALRLWLDILDHGINIVQLSPETIFRHERSDMADIIRAIVELSRGHSESRMRSVRISAAWTALVAQARKDGARLPCHLPAWVRERDGRLELIAERARAVKRIFALATQGVAAAAIARTLVREGVKPFADHVLGEDGKRRAKAGQVLGSGAWRRVYIGMVLRDRRAIGEFQPKDKRRKPDGPPIVGYYPPVVTEAEFYAARAAVAAHKPFPGGGRLGRVGKGAANLFGGLLVDANPAVNPETGDVKHGTYVIGNRQETGRPAVRVLFSNSAELPGGARGECFVYDTFERAILTALRELKTTDVLDEDKAPDAAEAEGELDGLRKRKAALSAELLKGDVAAIADALRQLEAREAELVGQLEKAKERAAKPLSESWKDAKTLVELLDKAPAAERESVRLRLRAALRRIIDQIWVLITHRGKDAMASVQIHFADGGEPRLFDVYRRGPKANGKAPRKPGWWRVRSVRPRSGTALAQFMGSLADLRDLAVAESQLAMMRDWDPEEFAKARGGVIE